MDQFQSGIPGSDYWARINNVESDSAAEEGEALSLRITRYLRSCWVRRRMVSGILATGILVTLLYALHLPVRYTSTTTLMPPDNASSNPTLMSLLPSVGPAAGISSAALGIRTPGALFVGILTSRTIQESLVTRFNLLHYYNTEYIEDARKRLSMASRIADDPKSGIITISVTDANPVLASNIARGYVEELNRLVINNSTSAARRERIFLEARLKEIKQDLDDSARVLSQFSAKNRTIDIPSQGKAMVESGLKLQDQMIAAYTELAGLRQIYSEDNVRVRAAHARIAELQRQMDKAMGSSEDPGLDASHTSYPSISELPALGLTYYDLDRKMRVEELLWETLTKQYESAKVQEAKEIPTVRVLDAANVPQRKSSAARRSIMLLGTMLSLFVACISVFVMNTWEEMDPQDERKMLVTEIVNSTQNFLVWFWSLPGMSWVYRRFKGSTPQSDVGNTS